ncbi:uncharacterized protein LOC114797733 [Denticeps clupeoides]|uniref:uncharacterized protein LOC114797733 n=1 Tax=Denticeps clupeoides TaxID=299321 RepID=UPI0010A499FD|nr:uncharacterized protein LOC114797733 [Denticeps clupeoides]
MSLVYVALLSLMFDVPATMGLQRSFVSGQLLLQMRFDPYYNFHDKSCCKFSPAGCLVFIHNQGYVDYVSSGRASMAQFNGGMEVRIWDLQKEDAGVYRCAVLGSNEVVYSDFSVEIVDAPYQRNFPPIPSQAPPLRLATAATAVDVPSPNRGPALSASSNLRIWLAAGLSVAAVVLVSLVLFAAKVHLKKRKKDQQDHGTRKCDAVEFTPCHHTQDVGPVIYTTVEFRTRQSPAGLYANLPRCDTRPPSGPTDTVEYSVVRL